jgi:hypothetical protein
MLYLPDLTISFELYKNFHLRITFDWCLIDMYSIRTTSNDKGMIIETLIYENQNLTRWYS